jgi:hypothetical protein
MWREGLYPPWEQQKLCHNPKAGHRAGDEAELLLLLLNDFSSLVYLNVYTLFPADAGWGVPLGSLECAPERTSQGLTRLFVKDELDQSTCPSTWVRPVSALCYIGNYLAHFI